MDVSLDVLPTFFPEEPKSDQVQLQLCRWKTSPKPNAAAKLPTFARTKCLKFKLIMIMEGKGTVVPLPSISIAFSFAIAIAIDSR
jgi:hypothetical protein